MRLQTPQEIRQSKLGMLFFAVPAVVLLSILMLVGFPSDLWTPTGTGDFLRAFICAILFALAGFLVYASIPVVQDWEVRTSLGLIVNPLTYSLPPLGFAGLAGCIVLIIRYVYLLILG